MLQCNLHVELSHYKKKGGKQFVHHLKAAGRLKITRL